MNQTINRRQKNKSIGAQAATLELHVERRARCAFHVVDNDNAELASSGAAERYLHHHEEPSFLHLVHAGLAVVYVAREHVDDGAAVGVHVDVA
jgi:hypothetical protein